MISHMTSHQPIRVGCPHAGLVYNVAEEDLRPVKIISLTKSLRVRVLMFNLYVSIVMPSGTVEGVDIFYHRLSNRQLLDPPPPRNQT